MREARDACDLKRRGAAPESEDLADAFRIDAGAVEIGSRAARTVREASSPSGDLSAGRGGDAVPDKSRTLECVPV